MKKNEDWWVVFMTSGGECTCSLVAGVFPVNGVPIRLEKYCADGAVDILEMTSRTDYTNYRAPNLTYPPK